MLNNLKINSLNPLKILLIIISISFLFFILREYIIIYYFNTYLFKFTYLDRETAALYTIISNISVNILSIFYAYFIFTYSRSKSIIYILIGSVFINLFSYLASVLISPKYFEAMQSAYPIYILITIISSILISYLTAKYFKFKNNKNLILNTLVNSLPYSLLLIFINIIVKIYLNFEIESINQINEHFKAIFIYALVHPVFADYNFIDEYIKLIPLIFIYFTVLIFAIYFSIRKFRKSIKLLEKIIYLSVIIMSIAVYLFFAFYTLFGILIGPS